MPNAKYLTYLEYQEYVTSSFASESAYLEIENAVAMSFDALTRRWYQEHINELDSEVIDRVKEALAIQISFVKEAGGVSAWLESRSAVSESETIGNYSHSVSYGGQGVAVEGRTEKPKWIFLAYSMVSDVISMGR